MKSRFYGLVSKMKSIDGLQIQMNILECSRASKNS
jgi:hypothetical protein